jgi:hypothetical protein
MAIAFYSWKTLSRLTDRSIRTVKRYSFDPNHPFPLAVDHNSQSSAVVAAEYDAYCEAFIGARRGDPEAQQRLDEMVARKKAILARMGRPTEPENLRKARGADNPPIAAAVVEGAS